jgi:hypothetical protein
MLAELYMVYRILRETLRRIVGVPPGSSLLATLFAFGVLVNAIRRIVGPVLKARRPSRPSSTAVMFGLAAPTAALRRVTGLGAPDALAVTTTVGVHMVMPTVHAAIASVRSVWAAIAAAGRMAIGRPPAG